MDYHHYYNFCFSETDREEAFKIGQPEERELSNLANDIVSTWESLENVVFSLFLTDVRASPPGFDRFDSQVGVAYTMLLNWKESLGSRASYRALARMLNTTIINAHDLVKTHCHDEGK